MSTSKPEYSQLIETVSKLTVLELSELVKAMEEHFGVSAAAPVASGVASAAAPVAEEKTSFDVHLKAAGANKIGVIKVIREITGLGLAESKALVEGAPKLVKEGLTKADADKHLKQLQDAGAEAELK